MDMPVLNGIIDRRILINYRVKPDLVKALLPPHLEPLCWNLPEIPPQDLPCTPVLQNMNVSGSS